jgi:hypothetical protein
VLLRDKTSGVVQKLDNPRTTTSVDGLLVDASGVYWSSREYSATAPSSISRHDVTANADTELTTLTNATGMTTNGKDIFYVRLPDDGHVHIEAVSITGGGSPRVVKDYDDSRSAFYAVVSADANALYFTRNGVDSQGTIGTGEVRVVQVDGSGEKTLATGFDSSASPVADAQYVYWVDQEAQNDVKRMNKATGAVDVVVQGEANRWVEALAVDDCNLYYAVANTAAVYAQSK